MKIPHSHIINGKCNYLFNFSLVFARQTFGFLPFFTFPANASEEILIISLDYNFLFFPFPFLFFCFPLNIMSNCSCWVVENIKKSSNFLIYCLQHYQREGMREEAAYLNDINTDFHFNCFHCPNLSVCSLNRSYTALR